jgi:hypothetical protein
MFISLLVLSLVGNAFACDPPSSEKTTDNASYFPRERSPDPTQGVLLHKDEGDLMVAYDSKFNLPKGDAHRALSMMFLENPRGPELVHLVEAAPGGVRAFNPQHGATLAGFRYSEIAIYVDGVRMIR